MPSNETSAIRRSELDWHMSDKHSVIISPVPKADKLAVWAAWAAGFDADVLSQGYTSPRILAAKLFARATSKTLSILDLGCGTGLVAPPFVETARADGITLQFVGLDYSQEMLDVAEAKALYTSVVKADLTEPLPFPDASFDFFVAGGLFVAGHCGPEVLPNLAKVLKVGGYALFTIRTKTYDDAEEQYLKEYQKAGFELVENSIAHYLGPIDAYYAILKKVRA